jgi:hypothetical protein
MASETSPIDIRKLVSAAGTVRRQLRKAWEHPEVSGLCICGKGPVECDTTWVPRPCMGPTLRSMERALHEALLVPANARDYRDERIAELEDVLRFYADDGTHVPPGHSAEGWCRDSGHRARLALGLPSVDG